ncbi:MAG: hypothetical protein AUJ82_07410 [Verrucomicrobia bacterium CG1_02_43_26]|nr:MAG: hypothetical protein AUJ82_07410 [Verrucomicrobia bacterium CG1_02_43_26]
MKLDQDNAITMEMPKDAHKIKLVRGLLGFSELREMEIVYDEGELPFMRLRETQQGPTKEEALEFFVVEPAGLIDNYSIRISEDDVEQLNISESDGTCLLNIVTIHNTGGGRVVTVNLVAPLLINKKTLKGKQVIIENFNEYSPRHLLYED